MSTPTNAVRHPVFARLYARMSVRPRPRGQPIGEMVLLVIQVLADRSVCLVGAAEVAI